MTSLVLGILGCVPIITGLLAVVFGIIGIRKTRHPHVRGRGMAIAGLVLGLVSLAGWGFLGGGLGIGYVRSKPARVVVEQFTADLASGSVAAAHARCTGSIGRPALDEAAAQIKPWGPLQDATVSRFHYGMYGGAETAQFNGVATFASTRAAFWFRLVKQAGAWKVDAYTFRDESQPVSGVQRTAPATVPAQP